MTYIVYESRNKYSELYHCRANSLREGRAKFVRYCVFLEVIPADQVPTFFMKGILFEELV